MPRIFTDRVNPVCRSLIAWVLVIMLSGVGGCAWFQSEVETEPADVLLQQGNDAYNEQDYKDALKNFEKLRDWYPFSKHIVLAELRIADSHYYLESYEEAIFAYEQFIELHPSNEAVPYVIYQIGRCYFDRMDTIDRDQTNVQKALEQFQRLQEQYPDTTYAEKATDHINACLKSLVRNEFYIGMFYYKSKHYRAAMHRFKAVVTQYPDVGVHRKALMYIALCEEKLAQQ
jgi:outer membrane protein assembly factor BamD